MGCSNHLQLKTVRRSQLQAPLGCAYSLRSIGLGNIGALRLVFEGLHLAPHPSPALLLSDRQQRTAVILPLADDTYRKTHHSAVLAIAAERLSRKRDAHIRHQRRVALGLPERKGGSFQWCAPCTGDCQSVRPCRRIAGSAARGGATAPCHPTPPAACHLHIFVPPIKHSVHYLQEQE